MITIQRQVEVDGDLDEIFAFVGHFDNTQFWDPGVSSANRIDDSEPIGVGTQYLVNAEFVGKTIPMTYEIMTWDPPHRVVLRGEGPAVVVTDDIRFSHSNGKTQIEYSADFSMKGTRAMLEPFMKPLFVRLADKAMDGMRNACRARRSS